MHLSLKAAAVAWANGAKEEVTKLENKIREHQADLKLAQELHAKLSAELAVYEAKKETL